MLIPRHWVRATGTADDPEGKRFDLRIWGWSQDSLAAAGQLAKTRLREACERIARGSLGKDAYFYGKTPLREEILRTIGPSSSEPAAIVTRNRYGALVLNTARVPFIDVDAPADGAFSGLRRLFGGKGGGAREKTLEGVREACGRFPRTSFRVYATAAGFRILATDTLLDPRSPEAQAMLTAFGADPFFVKLCNLQASFRARLTPKPWRCGVRLPPGGHPRDDLLEQRRFAEWLREYEKATASKGTCELVETLGPGRTLPEVAQIVREHDQACRVGEGLPLA